MKAKKGIALVLSLAMTTLLFAGCGFQGGAGGGGGTEDNSIVIVASGDPGRLRSDTINSMDEMPYNRLVYDYLFTRNSQGEYEPCLCESFTLDDDNLGVTLNLRQNVKFHNGNTMTANDVLASLYYGMQDTASGSQLDFIDFDNSAPVDDNTLYLKFNRINGVWQSALLAIGIIEREAYESAESADAFYLDPMTTSAYVLENWVSGDSLTFKAFPDHWYGAPKIENIIVRIISESSVALMELQTGGVDVLFNMSLENYQSACEMEGVRPAPDPEHFPGLQPGE